MTYRGKSGKAYDYALKSGLIRLPAQIRSETWKYVTEVYIITAAQNNPDSHYLKAMASRSGVYRNILVYWFLIKSRGKPLE